MSRREHLADAFLDVERLEQACAFSSTGVSRFAATRSASCARLLDRVDERARFARQLGHQLDDLLRDVAQAHGQRFGLDVVDLGRRRAAIRATCRYGASSVTCSMRTRTRPCKIRL